MGRAVHRERRVNSGGNWAYSGEETSRKAVKVVAWGGAVGMQNAMGPEKEEPRYVWLATGNGEGRLGMKRGFQGRSR